MNHPSISDEDLLAYLDGETLPQVEAALTQSLEVRQRLQELRADIETFEDIFRAEEKVSSQDLVDVATGQATSQQKLLVSAYMRRHPAVQGEMKRLQSEARRSEAKQQKLLPIFQALVMQTTSRSVRGQTDELLFQSVELNARVNVRISPMEKERGSISGIVTQNSQPAARARVMLRSDRTQPRPRYTDESERFVFARLRSGIYQLEVWFAQGTVQIANLLLSDE